MTATTRLKEQSREIEIQGHCHERKRERDLWSDLYPAPYSLSKPRLISKFTKIVLI